MSDYYSHSVADLPLFAAPAQAPAVQHSRTSMAAADCMDGDRLNSLQRSVVAFLKTRGVHGATDEEIADELEMNPSTVRPRRGELARRGLTWSQAPGGRAADGWQRS